MRNFILRVIIYAIGIALVAKIVPGIHVANDTLGTLLIIGAVFGLMTPFRIKSSYSMLL